MELLYVWIKEYKNIEEQGFNFSPKWRFHYNPENGELKVDDRREKVIDNFFGEHISNVTAIVGENGSGKSSLLRFITDEIFTPHKETDFLVIFTQNIYVPNSWVFSIEEKWLKVNFYDINRFVLHRFNSKRSFFPDSNTWDITAKSTQIIYYSNFFSGKDTWSLKERYQRNISTEFLVEKDLKDYGYGRRPYSGVGDVEAFSLEEVKRQVRFIADHEFEEFNFLPDRVSIKVNFFDYSILLREDSKFELAFQKKFGKGMPIINNDMESFLKNLSAAIVLNRMRHDFALFDKSDRKYDDFEKFEGQNYVERIVKYLRNRYTTKYYGGVTLADTLIPEIENWIELVQNGKNEGILNPKSGGIDIILNTKGKSFLKQFFSHYIKIAAQSGFLSFSWRNLSSGENAMLNLYSRFYFANKQLRDYSYQPEKGIILIDEGELGLHPKWQKKYFELLVEILPKIFCDDSEDGNRKRLQVVFASNSPFILSDLPKENVIFLKKDKQTGLCQVADGLNEMKQTFGANIHTLLSDSFFMDGLMGDFAKGKIDEVIQYLNGDTVKGMDDEKAEKIINMIGEPILKRHLEKQFQYRKQNAEIKELRKRIEKLENKNKPKE